jgi:succinate dehydrogenase / fumarate reductase membrane anchor subunit
MFRSDLARVRGLGSAKEGVHHWWMQRVSAVALVPLTLWFVIGVIAHIDAGHAAMKAWMASPLSAALMIAFVAMAFHHGQLGIQVVIEDYVHNEKLKLVSVMANNFFYFAVALAAIYAILKLSSGV